MKKKGFTLIELLAVIVILAIIALIATPIVMNVIESSRKGAAQRSAENYLRAVDIAIAEERINGPIEDGEYKIMSDGSLCKGTISETNCTGTKLSVEVDGTKPEAGGTILIQNGRVVNELTVQNAEGEDEIKTTLISVGEYNASVEATGKIVVTKKEEEESGESTTAKICTYDASSTVAKGQLGAKYNCTVAEGVTKQFYLLEIGGTGLKKKDRASLHYQTDGVGTAASGEVSLIMTENIDEGTTKYAESGVVTNGPVTALAYLDARTTNWKEEIQTFLPTCDQYWEMDNYSIISDTNYWFSSAYTDSSDIPAMELNNHEPMPSAADNMSGIRPVITISAEDCEL